MIRRVVNALLLAMAADAARAVTAVQTWQQVWAGSQTTAPTAVAARELVDGSRMVVAYQSALHAIRYDSAGNQISVSQFYPPFFSLYTFSGPNAAYASVVAIDPFGGVFVASVSDLSSSSTRGDIWVMKYDGLTGKTLWPNPVIYDDAAHQLDVPVRILIDPQGNAVILGRSSSSAVVFKCEGNSGSFLWSPSTITPATSSPLASLDSAGNILVTVSRRPSSYDDTETYKIDGQTGTVLWGPAQFGGLGHDDNPVALAVAIDGSVFVGSVSVDGIKILKYTGATGNLVWGPSVFGESLSRTDLTASPSGDVVLSGTGQNGIALLEYSGANGALLWGPIRIGSNGNPLAVRVAADGDVLLCAPDQASRLSTSRYHGGSLVWGPLIEVSSLADFSRRPIFLISAIGRVLTAVIDSDGTQAWLSTSEREADTGVVAWSSAYMASAAAPSYVTDLTQGPDGSVFVTGYAYAPTLRFVTFKYARSTGQILWGPAFYELPTNTFGYPFSVRTDLAGDVLVLGAESDAVVLKYSGATGALLWGPTKLSGVTPERLAIDAAGDVLVLGQSYAAGYDFATFKLSGASGGVLWGPVKFNSGPGRDDFPTAIAVTPSGDIVVSGKSIASSSSGDAEWETLKYSGSTGALIWGPEFLGGGSNVQDLALDGSGNVLVTGSTLNGQSYVMATLKYDGVTGTTLWGPKLVSGTGCCDASAYAVAVDSIGNVLVTGRVFDDHTPPPTNYNYDIATIKYQGSDGAVLWGPQILDGAAGGTDSAYALALDSDGNPVVGGTSSTATHNKDITIVKYDGTTGTLVWGPILVGGIGVDDLPLHNLVVTGKSVVIAGTSALRFLTAAYDESFGIQTLPDEIPPAYCGRAYDKRLVAGNASGSVAWSVVLGSLPPGLFLDPSTGEITGNPMGEGVFAFRVRAQDSAGPIAERDFAINVSDGSAFVAILATANPICPGQSTTLSVSGNANWSSYQWLPGGETSSTVTVSPIESADYGVLLTDGTGCITRGYGSVTVVSRSLPIQVPASVCANGTGFFASTTDAGPGATYVWTISNGSITSGAGTATITFSAGGVGYVQLSLTVTDSNGCIAKGTRSIPVSTCGLYTVQPCRVVDTRRPNGALGGPALASGSSRAFAIAGQCGVPADASSVSVNVTITRPSGDGYLTLHPTGAPLPNVSTINYRAGQTRANNAILSLGADGGFNVYCGQTSTALTVDFIVDVNGYFK